MAPLAHRMAFTRRADLYSAARDEPTPLNAAGRHQRVCRLDRDRPGRPHDEKHRAAARWRARVVGASRTVAEAMGGSGLSNFERIGPLAFCCPLSHDALLLGFDRASYQH